MWAAVLSILKEIEWLGVGTLTIQLLVVFCLLLALFYARKWKLGLLPLFVALSTFPFLQTTLAITKYVAIYKDYKVSPGSIIIFTSTLFIVQLVYIFKDAIELRKLCTVLFASSILTTTLMLLFQGGDSFQEGRTPLGNVEVMAIWVMAVGNVALMLDLFLIPAIYEVSGRRLTLLPVWARILLTMCSVSAIDSAIFILVGFYNSWNIVDAWILFKHLLLSAIVGKVVASCALTPILWLYLRWFEYSEDLGRPETCTERT